MMPRMGTMFYSERKAKMKMKAKVKKLLVAAVGFAMSSLTAIAAEFEINIPTGSRKTISEALSEMGKTSTDIKDKRIVKTGGGTLVGQTSVNTFLGTTINEGVFEAALNDAFGQPIHTDNADTIYVRDGATLAMTGTTDSYNINNRKVHIAGSGASGMAGAIVGKRALPIAGQWFLDADAVVASDNADATADTGYTKLFEKQSSPMPYLNFKGRTLTLRAVNGSKGFLMAWGFRFLVSDAVEDATGRIVLDGCELADRSKTFASFVATRDARSYVTLVLKNGASFRPSSQAPVSLFAGIDAESGTTIGAFNDNSVAAFGITVGDFAGVPTFEEKITSLTVTNQFTARATDLADGKCLTLAGPITFGSGTKVAVEGDLTQVTLDQDGRVKIAVSETSVSGNPIPSANLPLGWSVEMGSDGKSLDLINSAFVFSVADRKSGTILNVNGDLVFDGGTPLVVDGNLDDLSEMAAASTGQRVTIVRATGSISGLPVWTQTWATRHWTLELGADGKSIEFVYDSFKPLNAIDVVTDWGLKTGPENASYNSLTLESKFAELTSGRVIYFPKGEYYLAETLVIDKAESQLRGDCGESVLRAADGFVGSTLVSVVANYCSARNMVFQGCVGPAVSAVNCTSLVAYGNMFRDATGTIEGVDGKYPISAVNVANVEVYGNAPAASPTPYAGAVYLGGTSTKTGKCEPSTSEVNLLVGVGESLEFYTALSRTSYTKSDLKGQKIIKLGAGALIGTDDLADNTGDYFTGLDVKEGVFCAHIDADFGYKDYGNRDPLWVRSGATVRLLANPGKLLVNNRLVHLAGSGAYGQLGALVCDGHAEVSGAQFRLDDDAVVATTFTADYALVLQSGTTGNNTRSNCAFDGHTLTLRGADGGKGFRFVNRFQMRGQGRVVVDGVYLGQSSAAIGAEPFDNTSVTLDLRNGATFRPRTQGLVALFDRIETDATSQVWGGEGGATAFDMTIGGWAGAGSVSTGIASLTIANSFTVSADDILTGHYLTAPCPIVFANGAQMTLENAEDLSVAGDRYICAVSEASVSGVPHKATGCPFKGWDIGLGMDNRSLQLFRRGFMMSVR